MEEKRSWNSDIGENEEDSTWLDEDLAEPTQSIVMDAFLAGWTEDDLDEGDRDFHATTFGKLIEALPIPAFLVDSSGRVALGNTSSRKITSEGVNVADTQFQALFRTVQGADEFTSRLKQVVSTGKTQVIEGVLQTSKGAIWGRLHMRSLKIGQDRAVLLLVEDLTPQKRQLLLKKKHEQILETRVKERTAELERINTLLRKEIRHRRETEAKLRLSSKIIESSNEAVLVTNLQGNIVDVNPAFTRMTGYSRAEVLGKNPRFMKSERHEPEFYQDMWKSLIETGQWYGEVWDRRKNGGLFAKLLSIAAVRNDHGKPELYVGIFSDITKMKETERRLERLAHYDPLTGLPNRVLFRDRLRQAILRADRTGKAASVMFLDLDRFKDINDTLGHPVGDRLLAAASKRLLGSVRRSDTVARIGGDEFTLVLSDFADIRSLAFLARKIIARLAEPFALDDREVFITCSIGIALYPSDGQEVDRLLQNADTAMYHAKEEGKNRFRFFSDEMNVKAMDRLELETALRSARQKNELILHYQPQIDLSTGRITGAEALIRWKRQDNDLVLPDRFISLAEETGLINSLGDWVLSEACRQLVNWARLEMDTIRVAVNMSGRQLQEDGMADSILEVIRQSGTEPDLLELEITESTLMQEGDQAVNVLHRLRNEGVHISIDDFGTGYSSLGSLKRLPIDRLKIDTSFIKEVTENPEDEAIVKAIIAVAHSLKLRVIAEGVETEAALEFLKSQGCDEVQGFLLGHPVPADQFAELLFKQQTARP